VTSLPPIDPALGLDLVGTRTLAKNPGRVSVIIPAHNEAETITEVVTESQRGLDLLGAEGEVIVSASGCTDATADLAAAAGARVILSPPGKGNALKEGFRASNGEIICLVDGDIRYFGDEPLASLLVRPILNGISDATITDLYWRPLYPQMWLHAFFAPLAGMLFPEMLPKCGSTPWSGQRAARRHLWPSRLPDEFTVDIEILLHWNKNALRLRPVLADDWVNPQRPKTDLMSQELQVLIEHAVKEDRLDSDAIPAVERWYEATHHLMATYRPERDDPQQFEQLLLSRSTAELQRQLTVTPRRSA
jgi:glycosyltransferase involved in cell wall biosynthesis